MRWVIPLLFLATAGWLHWEAGQDNHAVYTFPMLADLMPSLKGDLLAQQDMTRNLFAGLGLFLLGSTVVRALRSREQHKLG
jgi:hypothetical protein